MGRHRLHPTPRLGRARHAARRAPVRIGAPTALVTALLVGAPGGVAFAADDPPAAPVDELGTALGDALGTDTPEPDQSDVDDPVDEGPDTDAPVSGAEIVQDTDTVPDTVRDADVVEDEPAGATDVTLLEKNGSGVSGDATIDAETVVATASGLDPAERYVSFFYGATSSATNNNPCILDGTNPLPGEQTVGEWDVDDDGNGTLSAPNPLGERYTLQAGTMSIRKVEHDFSTATALPVNPLSYSLVACGEVERLAVLDPVTDLVPKLPTLPSVPPLS